MKKEYNLLFIMAIMYFALTVLVKMTNLPVYAINGISLGTIGISVSQLLESIYTYYFTSKIDLLDIITKNTKTTDLFHAIASFKLDSIKERNSSKSKVFRILINLFFGLGICSLILLPFIKIDYLENGIIGYVSCFLSTGILILSLAIESKKNNKNVDDDYIMVIESILGSNKIASEKMLNDIDAMQEEYKKIKECTNVTK